MYSGLQWCRPGRAIKGHGGRKLAETEECGGRTLFGGARLHRGHHLAPPFDLIDGHDARYAAISAMRVCGASLSKRSRTPTFSSAH